MKRFVVKIAIFMGIFLVLMIGAAFAAFEISGPQYSYSYNASIIDKVDRLMNIEGAKIVLIGDSNVAFGMDSEMIEEAFDMPVVNLGIHGGLGNAFHENIARLNVGEGDILVLASCTFEENEIGDPELAWMTLENQYDLWQLVDSENYLNMLKALPAYLRKNIWFAVTGTGNTDSADSYSRKAFNEYGDVSYPRESGSYEFQENDVEIPVITSQRMDKINELDAFCKRKGATLVLAGYPIGDGVYTPSKEEYEEFGRQLDSYLNCNVISDYTDYFFDYDYFYDSKFHLTSDGAELRTAQLIEDLKNAGLGL